MPQRLVWSEAVALKLIQVDLLEYLPLSMGQDIEKQLMQLLNLGV